MDFASGLLDERKLRVCVLLTCKRVGPGPLSDSVVRQWDKTYTDAMDADKFWLHQCRVSDKKNAY